MADIVHSTDPFDDGTLLRKWTFDIALTLLTDVVVGDAFDPTFYSEYTETGGAFGPYVVHGVPPDTEAPLCALTNADIPEVSVSLFLKANSFSNSTIVSSRTDAALSGWQGISLQIVDNQFIVSYRQSSSWSSITYSASALNDGWTHVGFYAGAAGGGLIIDGVEVASTSEAINNADIIVAETFHLGLVRPSDGGDSLATMDQLEVYNRVLLPEEWVMLKNQNTDVAPTDESIFLGSTVVDKFMLGSIPADKVMLGTNEVFSKT